MSGSLGEWSIEDLLQIARITHKTTCIEIEGPDRSGLIFLRSGAIVDAVVEGAPPSGGSRFSKVVEAIETMAATEDGTFHFSARPLPSIADRPIEVPAALAAMQKDAIREKRLTDLGVDPGQGLAIGRHIEGAMSLKPAVWQLIADLIEPFSLEALQLRMGRRKAVATLLTLDALGVLERHGSDTRSVGPVEEPAPVQAVPEMPLSEQEDTADEGELEPLFEPLETTESIDDASACSALEQVEAPVPDPDTADTHDEPIVEIFGSLPGDPQGLPAHDMHEVVAPSETTLVSDVLGDMRSRFRHREYLYEAQEEDD